MRIGFLKVLIFKIWRWGREFKEIIIRDIRGELDRRIEGVVYGVGSEFGFCVFFE